MNRLIAKLTGHSVANWAGFLKNCDAEIAALQTAAAPLLGFDDELAAARAAFEASPSPQALEKWVASEARRSAIFAIEQDLRTMLSGKRQALLSSPEAMGKMRDAFSEIRSGLERRRAQVVENDAARSLENGIPEVSAPTLEAIDRQLGAVDDGLRWLEVDPLQSAGLLRTLLG